MPLQAPPDADPERILLYGGPAAGKTYAWLAIADLAQKTRSDAHFYVIDTDRAVGRSLRGPNAEFGHLKNVTVYQARVIEDAQEAAIEILPLVGPNDWIVVDMLSNIWDGMSNWWISKVYDEDPVTYWAGVRQDIIVAKEAGSGDPREFGGQAGPDWQYITKTYMAWELPLTIDAPCHVLATAAETEIQERYDPDGEKRARYVSTNFMAPRGQKMTEHRFHTVLRMTSITTPKETTREITKHKDRVPEVLWQELGGKGLTIQLGKGPKFGMDYLRKVGKWTLT